MASTAIVGGAAPASTRRSYELLGLQPNAPAVESARCIDRMVLRMVDEAARCLDEGVVGSVEVLDAALLLGIGFPRFRGGLCHWADRQGVGHLVVDLDRLAAAVGERFEASGALRAVAVRGGFYHGRAPETAAPVG